MKQKELFVSIVILNFNRPNDLLETLSRTKDIKWRNKEIIIVDNGSTDDSYKIINKLDNKVYKKVFIKKNQGSAYGHQIGMEKAKGDLIVTLDDDAFINPHNIELCVEYFLQFPKLAAIGFGMVNPNTNFNIKDYKSVPKTNYSKNNINNSYETIVATSAAIYRKKALESINYYDLNWNWYTEDLELNLRLIHKGYNTINMPELIAYHKSSLVNRNFNVMTQNSIEGMILIYFKYFKFLKALQMYLIILFDAVCNSIYARNLKYIKYSIIPLNKIVNVLKDRKLLNKKQIKAIKLPHGQIFSRL